MSDHQPDAFGTRVIHAGQEPDPTTGAVITPIYATSTYVQQSPGVHKGYDYARIAQPHAFCVRALRRGSRGRASRVLRLPRAWPRQRPCSNCSTAARTCSALDDLYGGTLPACSSACGSARPIFDFSYTVIRERGARSRRRYGPHTRMFWVESPTNPLLKLVDLTGRAHRRQRGMLAVVDNTFATPWVQRPLSRFRHRGALGDQVSERPFRRDRRRGGDGRRRACRAPGASAERGRCGAQRLRQLSGTRGTQDPGRAHGRHCENALGDRRLAGAPRRGRTRAVIPGSRVIHNTRSHSAR